MNEKLIFWMNVIHKINAENRCNTWINKYDAKYRVPLHNVEKYEGEKRFLNKIKIKKFYFINYGSKFKKCIYAEIKIIRFLN